MGLRMVQICCPDLENMPVDPRDTEKDEGCTRSGGRGIVKRYNVGDLMVPLSEYATAPLGATLQEAVLALEKAQEEFDHFKYRHRAILIVDGEHRVVGKLNQLDALKALVSEYAGCFSNEELMCFRFTSGFIRHLHQQRLTPLPLKDLCENAGRFKVEDYMGSLSEDECIDHRAELETAIQQLVQEDLRSLLVTRQGKITGILRATDLFSVVFHTMAERSLLS